MAVFYGSATTPGMLHVQTFNEILMLVQMNAPQGVGYGIGLIFVLFLMQEIASLVQTHYVIRESHHCTLACSVME
jgi:hypothetical protein